MVSFLSQPFIGWSALVNAVAEITSFTALILFFRFGGLWGPINDTLSVIWALTLIPLAVWLIDAGFRSSPGPAGGRPGAL